MPLDPSISEEVLNQMKEFCEAFYFGMRVEVMDLVDIRDLKVKS